MRPKQLRALPVPSLFQLAIIAQLAEPILRFQITVTLQMGWQGTAYG